MPLLLTHSSCEGQLGLGDYEARFQFTKIEWDGLPEFIEAIDLVNEVIECHHVTGSSDFILKVITQDIPSYQKLMLERVSEIEVVDSMQSMVILSTFKDSKVMPIPTN